MADDTQAPPADFDDRAPSEGSVRGAQRMQEIMPPMANAGGALMVQAFGGVVMAQKVDQPRNLQAIEKEIQKVCAIYGEQFYYSWEVKSQKSGKTVVSEVAGVTVDGAAVLRQIWRNNLAETVVVKDDGEFVYFASRFVDYETGNTVIRPFKQRTGMRFGKMQKDRVMETTFSIGVSKAERNVTLDALRIQREQMLRYAKDNLREKIGKDLPKAKARLMQLAAEVQVPLEKLERYVERHEKDWVANHIVRLVQAIRAIQEGDATIDDVFGQEVTEGDLGEERQKSGNEQKAEQQQADSGKKEPEKAASGTEGKKAEPAKKEPAKQAEPPKEDPKPKTETKAKAAIQDQIRSNPEDRRPADEEPAPEEDAQGGFGWLGQQDADLGEES